MNKWSLLLLSWWLLALVFNIVSIVRVQLGLSSLTPSDPVLGSLFISVVMLAVVLRNKWINGFKLLMPLLLLLLAWGGVVSHLQRWGSTEYPIELAFFIAVGLNSSALLFGLALVIQFFKDDRL